jgi:putative chitinase
MIELTTKMLRSVTPRSPDFLLADLVYYMNVYLPKYKIYNQARVTHFLAQAAHESAGFTAMEEFASGKAYEGRTDLGNVVVGDGKRFKGRGIFQLTGRDNYRIYGFRIGVPLMDNPYMAAQPENAVPVACEYWTLNNLNDLADADDIEKITRRINGGINGLEDRKAYHQKFLKVIPKNIFGSTEVVATDINTQEDVLIKIGDRGEDVKTVQGLLYDAGYAIVVDGIFGPRTELIIKDFQKKVNLPITGVVDVDTFAQLKHNGSKKTIKT